ncbi:MAG TPA: hypothetical protein VG457_05485 [Planctomycetota bacterium]|jgi:hypothetical protein|nr:hypothetical protein [Planctomycetota bacterium]
MKCPKCGLARPLADQVCRRCKYLFEEDRFLELAPPRASGKAAPPRFFTVRSWDFPEAIRSSLWIPPLASLIPGLGHVIQARLWLGVLYFVLTVLLFGMSVTFFGQTTGQMLFGMAVSTHATCILDTTPWGRSPEAKHRILGMAVILTTLMFLYWPLVVRLANLFVPAEHRNGDGIRWRPIQALSVDQLVIMGILFLVSVAASTWMGRRLSSREY